MSLEALVEHCTASSSSEEGEDQEEPALSYDTDVSVIALFDHEEVSRACVSVIVTSSHTETVRACTRAMNFLLDCLYVS